MTQRDIEFKHDVIKWSGYAAISQGQGYEASVPERFALAITDLNRFVADVQNHNIAPEMRVRREALLRKYGGRNEV